MITRETPPGKVLELGGKCSKCAHCCSYGSGFLVGDDLKNISGFLGAGEEEVVKRYLEEKELFNKKLLRPRLKIKGRPYGECIFLDGKGCRIHEVKPFQCRVGNCSEHGEQLGIWFMLNHIVDRDDPESVRLYATYLKSGGKTIPGGRIEELVPDKKRLKDILGFERLK